VSEHAFYDIYENLRLCRANPAAHQTALGMSLTEPPQ
jgi:hypothetical protein